MIVKIILLELASVSLAQVAAKTQYIVHLNFNFILQLINGISRDLQKLFRYFNGTAIAAYFGILSVLFGVGCATVLSNNLAL